MSTVGYATLQIIPSMRNISGAITGGLSGLPAVGRRAGNAIGDGIASGVEQKQAAVDKAATKVATARGKEEDAAGKVRVAEAQLQELRDKGITGGARLTAAEERVAAARRRAVTATGAARTAASDLEDAQRRLADSSDDVADSAGQMEGAFDGIGEQAAGAASGLGKMAIAAAGVGSAMEIASTAMDFQQVTAKMNAGLGASGEVAEKYGKAAGDLYKAGLGSSMEDAAEAIKAVSSSFATLGYEGEVSLQKAGERAMNFANVFDQDVSSAVQTASQLVQNGLAKDSTQAFDLMTTAFQRVPAAMQEELPEILQEYGTNFRALGFSGESSFNLLVAAAGKGKFALDKTGDALKEFTIRGADMSKTSTDAFKSVGLDAEDMAGKIAAGGPGAQQALQSTAKGLLAMKDPAERANAAIALFGAPLEDLSVDQIPEFLSALGGGENAMAGFEGSADKMGEAVNDTAQSKLTGFTRALQTGVIEALGSTVGFLADNAGLFRDLGVAAGIAGTALALMAGPQLVTWIKTMVTSTKTWSIAQAALNLVMQANPFVKAAMLIAALVGAIVIAYRNSETFRNVVQAAWQGIQSVIAPVVDWFKSTVAPVLSAALDVIKTAIGWVVDHWKIFAGALLIIMGPLGIAIGAVVLIVKHLGFFKSILSALGTAIGWFWNTVVAPAFAGIGMIIGAVWNGIVKPLLTAFLNGLKLLGAAGLWLWNNVIAPAFAAIGAIIGAAWNGIVKPAIDGIKAGFQAVGDVLTWLWDSVISPVWQWIGQKIDDTKVVIGFAIDKIKEHFQAVGDKATEIKDWIVDKFNNVVDFFKGLPGKFGDIASKVFSPFQDAAKSVFNAIARFWNNTVGRLSFKAPDWIPGIGGKGFSIPKIPELASGGVVAGIRNGLLYGPGTGTSDSIRGVGADGAPTAMVSAGEFVVNAKATAANLPLLRAINGGAQTGTALAAGGLVPGGKLEAWDGEGGLKPVSVMVRRLIHALWGQVTDIGGYRESDPFPDHPSGQALDIMISDVALGNDVKAWLMDNKDTFGLNYSIWQQKYEPAAGGGNIMEDRGSPTQNHMDHIHALFGEIGAPPDVNPDVVPEGLKLPGGELLKAAEQPAPVVDPAATTPPTTETPDTSSKSTETPKRMKSFRELGSDVGGLVADGIVDFFGIPSWIVNPAGAIKSDDGSSVRTDGATTPTPETPVTPETPAQPSTPAPPKDPDAKDYSGWITKAAKDLKLPERAAVIGNATALVESGDPMQMWANEQVPESMNFPHDAVGSDYDSVGLFQQRDNGAWGTVAQRMNPFESAKLFYDAMLKVSGWETMPEGDVAQAVQRSAFPGKYAGKVGVAQELVKKSGLYDRGGWLQPGGVAFNQLKKPEPILHPDHWSAVVDQTEAVGELVGAGVGGGGGTQIVVYGNTAGDIADEIDRRTWRGSRGYGSRAH